MAKPTDMITGTKVTIMDTRMTTDAVSSAALYRLLAFLSPAFPIGSYTYSHGLEQVIEEGEVTDAQSLKIWLGEVLRFGAGRSDIILAKETMLAAMRDDKAAVCDLIDLGLALQPSRERHLETSAQGTAFIDAVVKAWLPEGDSPAARVFASLTDISSPNAPKSWPYPVAVGLTAAAWNLPTDATATGLLHAFSTNIISAAVRAVPLGQSDGQRVLAALEETIAEVTREALDAGLDELGTCSFLADIASMAHETKYSRLFRS
ncbi:urease accessory protein UreF [Labrenzia sp. CE80]|uniref:urease accessory protein UreF n=1 Tax=Labrenzia sp. CE80 TaxID=1788986 RepID=UPI002571254F|nr:urease accessory protein UreF [Labrenzia sp. CE80]